jgi:hypothetical protein
MYTATSETWEGLLLLKHVSPKTVSWVAPELNLFAVKKETSDCGAPGVTCSERFFNIRREDQPDTLFDVPADAGTVTHLSEPGGITKR